MRNGMAKTTHGMIKSLEYRSWISMKQRCFNLNHKYYSNYGGRGITVCDRWKNSFENFFADMGSRISHDYSLDRIDNNKNYFAENCKWSTRKEQINNRRKDFKNRENAKLITINFVSLTAYKWEKKMGYKIGTIKTRLNRGWSEYDAVMTPVETDRLIAIGSKTYTIAQWTDEMGYGRSVIQSRLKLGWSEYRAVMTPIKQRKSA